MAAAGPPTRQSSPATRFWRVNLQTDYGALNGVAHHRAYTGLNVRRRGDLYQLARTLKLDRVQAHALMRTIQVDERPTKLAQAVTEGDGLPKSARQSQITGLNRWSLSRTAPVKTSPYAVGIVSFDSEAPDAESLGQPSTYRFCGRLLRVW